MKMLLLIVTLMNSEMARQEIHANDPGYSMHNYKHVHKAKAVAKKDTNEGTRVSFDETTNRDYKKPVKKSKEKVLQIFIKTDDKDHLKVKNYKMPNG
jgi:hypothetical protein